jgi:hypothetical protein
MVDNVNLNTILANIPAVDIDSHGKFKYILIKAELGSESLYFVRGYSSCNYHAEVYEKFRESLIAL